MDGTAPTVTGVDAVRKAFALTRRHLGHDGPSAASVEEYVKAVCAAHARGNIPDRAVRDLALYELSVLSLPAPSASAGAAPRDDEPCVLAPHVRLVMFGADLPGMLDALRAGKPATPRPAFGWLLVTPGGERRVAREHGWLLEQFREPCLPSEAFGGTGVGRETFETFWREGLLVRADTQRA